MPRRLRATVSYRSHTIASSSARTSGVRLRWSALARARGTPLCASRPRTYFTVAPARGVRTGSGTSKTVMLQTAGTFPFYCDIHALVGMKGAAIVEP